MMKQGTGGFCAIFDQKDGFDEYMVVFITLEEAFPKAEGIVKALVSEFLMIKSIIQNIKPKKGECDSGRNKQIALWE